MLVFIVYHTFANILTLKLLNVEFFTRFYFKTFSILFHFLVRL